MTGYVLQVSGDGPDGFVWADADTFSQYALPSAFAKFTREAKDALGIEE